MIVETNALGHIEQVREWRELPRLIRVESGPELIADVRQQWCSRHNVQLLHIQPGKPNQNAFIERFNRSWRNEAARRSPIWGRSPGNNSAMRRGTTIHSTACRRSDIGT